MTTTRDLIQRLADALEGHIDHVPAHKEEVAEEQADLIDQARAYLILAAIDQLQENNQ